MLDLETLGTRIGSVIAVIGAVTFDPEKEIEIPERLVIPGTMQEHPFYTKVEVQSCYEAGLTTDPATIAWWYSQGKEARKEVFGENKRIALKTALFRFSHWYLEHGATHIWAHGSIFDISLLQYAYEVTSSPVPWDFRNVRDTRTLFELAGMKYKSTDHHALLDAYKQAQAVQQAYKMIS
jgi:hypothetical protein